MNRNDALKIAETITNEQIKQMFDNAQSKITDWTKIATANKGLTKGTAWNILAKDFDVNKTHHILAKKNMIWEFGDYLPEELKIKRQKTIRKVPPVHQEPIFNPELLK